jgi:hypothetical protein
MRAMQRLYSYFLTATPSAFVEDEENAEQSAFEDVEEGEDAKEGEEKTAADLPSSMVSSVPQPNMESASMDSILLLGKQKINAALKVVIPKGDSMLEYKQIVSYTQKREQRKG